MCESINLLDCSASLGSGPFVQVHGVMKNTDSYILRNKVKESVLSQPHIQVGAIPFEEHKIQGSGMVLSDPVLLELYGRA